MNIAISGATGFIGSNLEKVLVNDGHYIIHITRKELLYEEDELDKIIEKADAVINLAGTSINKRWNKKYKNELWESRVLTTQKIVTSINKSSSVKLFISTSAAGYYNSYSNGSEASGMKGKGFLSDLCKAWELEAMQVKPQVRLVISRLGVVLSPQGGAFIKITAGNQFNILPIMGKSSTPFSWISLKDLLRIYLLFIKEDKLHGIYNLSAPEHTTQESMTRQTAAFMGTRFVITIPPLLVKLLLGETASIFLDGPYAYPEKLLRYGFNFEHSTFNEFLHSLEAT